MKDLKLPIIKGQSLKSKVLSMDDYLKFVRFNLTQAFHKKAYMRQKKMLNVNVPFCIK